MSMSLKYMQNLEINNKGGKREWRQDDTNFSKDVKLIQWMESQLMIIMHKLHTRDVNPDGGQR